MNMGGSIQGLSSNLGTSGNRNSVPGNPALGNLGPRITSSAGNIVGGSNIGRNISSGGLSVPSISSRIDFSGNAASGRLNVQGSNRMMNGLIPQGSSQLMNMIRSSYPTSGGSLSQNQMQPGNNSLAGGPQGQYGSLRKQGVGVNSIVQQNQEFSIQNEDFSALPGFKGRPRSAGSYFGVPVSRGIYVGGYGEQRPLPIGYYGFPVPQYSYSTYGTEYIYPQGTLNPYVGQQYVPIYGVLAAANTANQQFSQLSPSISGGGNGYPMMHGYSMRGNQFVHLTGSNIINSSPTNRPTIQAPFLVSAPVPSHPHFIVPAHSPQFTQASGSD
ncbi:hypothetical protein ZWY2020_045072 [Hordeum vulgare]|nr:hypothetical protein ZWY2020_045072 [Hordeum vulgare]